jgi:hypothetical protein
MHELPNSFISSCIQIDKPAAALLQDAALPTQYGPLPALPFCDRGSTFHSFTSIISMKLYNKDKHAWPGDIRAPAYHVS